MRIRRRNRKQPKRYDEVTLIFSKNDGDTLSFTMQPYGGITEDQISQMIDADEVIIEVDD